MGNRIQTLHPQGKKGVNIEKIKYDLIKNAILEQLEIHHTITYSDLNDILVDNLKDTFDGSIPWYVVTVKLDLEARGIIERVPKTSPHGVRLVK